jgi:heme exporter protein D
MIWSSAGDFFAMGGYGLYVWGSYGVVAAWMLMEPVLVMRRHGAALSDVRISQSDGEIA